MQAEAVGSRLRLLLRLLPAGPPRRGMAGGSPHRHNLSETSPDAHRIQGFTAESFTIAGAAHVGPTVVVGQTPLRWRVASLAEAAQPEALAVFRVVRPRLEMLVVGTGARTLRPPPPLVEFCRTHGIALETMDSRRACATYNFLVEEGRFVAAALLPVGWAPAPA
jgi:NADH dehydrogenase [ubiquinone] 1 alpha subcomplex assembly factor 3